jgi:hypothetical protein
MMAHMDVEPVNERTADKVKYGLLVAVADAMYGAGRDRYEGQLAAIM